MQLALHPTAMWDHLGGQRGSRDPGRSSGGTHSGHGHESPAPLGSDLQAFKPGIVAADGPMPENSRRVYETQSIGLSKVAETPARYAYEWLTDYRADDGRLSPSRPRFRVIRVARDRVVRIRIARTKNRTPPIALELVRLKPPNSWHVDQIDERDLATVDYKVTSLGRSRCRITLHILERWMTAKHPTLSEYRDSTGEFWDSLVKALEARYRSGKPAIGS